MGTIVRRSGGYRVVIRRTSLPKAITKQFAKKVLAQRWMHEKEMQLDARAQTRGQAGGLTVGGLLMRYVTGVVDKKPYTTTSNRGHLVRFAKRFADDYVGDCDAAWWIAFAESLDVKPISRLKYLDGVAGALRAAESMKWCCGIPWDEHRAAMVTLKQMRLVGGDGAGRERRVSPEELAAVKVACKHADVPMADIIDFAIELGMRQAEICRLRWSDLVGPESARMIWVRNRKHTKKKMGNDWLIPLLGTSYEIIKRQPRTSELIFPYAPEAVCNAFRRVVLIAGIDDLHFHDLRHEAISRLFECGYQIQEVALVSGHKSWKSLMIYTQIQPKDLHKGPAARRPI